MNRLANASGRPRRFVPPTPREIEVLKMLAAGKTAKEIAAELNLKVKTVEVHKENLARKLGLHSRAQLVWHAIQEKSGGIPDSEF